MSTGSTSFAAWSVLHDIARFDTGSGPSTPLDAPSALPASGVSPGVDASGLHYYVRFTLHDGSTVTVDGNQLFALSGFALGDNQTLNIGHQSSGSGAGEATFSPLHLDFSQQGLDPQLFSMLASGIPFKEVDVLGY